MAESVTFPLDMGRLTTCEPKILYFRGGLLFDFAKVISIGLTLCF